MTTQTKVLGYRIERTDSDTIPYQLHGPRGGLFSLVRNQADPTLLGVINMGNGFGRHEIKGFAWMRERDGELIPSR